MADIVGDETGRRCWPRRRPGRDRRGPARPRLATAVATWAPTTGTSRSRTSPPPGRSGWPRSATEQAELAAHRPQGRALVRVRRGRAAPRCAASRDVDRHRHRRHAVPGRLGHGWSSPGTSVDHAPGRPPAAPGPPRRHRGAARGARRWSTGTGTRHDEIAESWTHIEIDQLRRRRVLAELQQDLQRVLADVGWRSRTGTGCRPRPLQLAEQLRAAGRGSAGERRIARRGRQALLRWLADGHFTFLGYREYDLVDGAGRDGAARRARHRPGHPAARPGAVDVVRGAAARGAGPGQGPAAADPDQGQLPLHRAPAQLPGLRRDQADRRRPARWSASTGSSACTPTWPTPRASPGSRCCGASSTEVLERRRASPRTATTART